MRRTALRILDANANRVREGLRTIEDVLRFGHDDAGLAAELKQLRHAFATALGGISAADLLASRDTAGDVGTHIHTVQEAARADETQVVLAAFKRVQEALRSMEEAAKLIPPDAGHDASNETATKLGQIRYACYDVEAAVARHLAHADRLGTLRLYVLITARLCKQPWQDVAQVALVNGADALQLREKAELPDRELLRRARWLRDVCREHGRLFVVNDRPDLAALADADGVHIGHDDLPVAEVRRIVGQRTLVGVSTHTQEQIGQALVGGADLIAVGPVFATSTKPESPARWGVVGLEMVRAARQAMGQHAGQPRGPSRPLIAIGGITPANAGEVIAAGASCVAVSAAVLGHDNPAEAMQELRNAIK